MCSRYEGMNDATETNKGTHSRLIMMFLALSGRKEKSPPEESRVDRLRRPCQRVDRSRLLPVVCQRGNILCIIAHSLMFVLTRFHRSSQTRLLLWGPQGKKRKQLLACHT